MSTKFPLNKKFELIFDIIADFDDNFIEGVPEITLQAAKGVLTYLYEILMIPIPSNEVENMIDLLASGSTTSIAKVIINSDTDSRINLPAKHFNQLANYIHSKYLGKMIFCGDEEFMKFTKEIFIRELDKVSFNPIKRLLPKNKIDITYITNGMRHNMRIEFDSTWAIINDITEKTALNNKLLLFYKNILSLSNTDQLLNKQEFMGLIQKVPLINYLASLENVEITPIMLNLQKLRYEVVFTLSSKVIKYIY